MPEGRGHFMDTRITNKTMSISYKMNGQIKQIGETQTFASGFQKRQLIVSDGADKYPQDISFEVVKDNCPVFDSYQIGNEVEIDFNINGSEFNGKHFVNLRIWKITKTQSQDAMPEGRQQQKTMPPAPAPGQAASVDEDEDSSEIPF